VARFTIRKRFTFEAAHVLPHHGGKCSRMHGHSWVGWVEIEGDELHAHGPSQNMVMDFGDIADALQPMVDQHLDHHLLNETLDMESPTSEAVAQWVYRHLRARGLPLSAVTIEETCTSVCTYRE
jgi:6-pyruvoyltetrahydropterin/6-carboxytetrahydropterin synthase